MRGMKSKLVIIFIVLSIGFSYCNGAYQRSHRIQTTNHTNVLEKWKDIEKLLKGSVQSAIKTIMPMVYEASNQLNISSQCMTDTLLLVAGLRNLNEDALRFVDSSVKMADGIMAGSVSFLGAYSNCLNTTYSKSKDKSKILFRGKYCIADVRFPLPPKHERIRSFDELELSKNYTGTEFMRFMARRAHLMYFVDYKLGLCIPSGCSEYDIDQLVHFAFQKINIDAEIARCEMKKEEIVLTTSQLFAITICGLLGILVITGTWVERHSMNQKPSSHGVMRRIFMSFSLINNFNRLVSTDVTVENFRCINGIKFFSIMWVTLGHVYLFTGLYPSSYRYLLEAHAIVRDPSGQAILNGACVVDTFYFMSGFLVSYLTIKLVVLKKKNLNLKWFLFLRFWRIAPTYYFIVLFASLAPLMGSGPLFQDVVDEYYGKCSKYWWRNLLFINNFFDIKDMCMLHTWYVSCEFQLYIASLLVLLPLLRSEKAAVAINVFIILFSIAYTGIITYVFDIMPTMSWFFPDPLDRNYFWVYTYANPIPRAGPYFIGILTGYLLMKKPDIKISKPVLIIGWCVSALSTNFVVFGTTFWYTDFIPVRKYIDNLMYATFHKVAFILGVAWMTFCCMTGYGGFINSILSWKVWGPLSKLTFLIYLIDPIFQTLYVANYKSPHEITHLFFVVEAFGVLCICVLLALICNLLIESPLVMIQKIFLQNIEKEEENLKDSTCDEKDEKEPKNKESVDDVKKGIQNGCAILAMNGNSRSVTKL